MWEHRIAGHRVKKRHLRAVVRTKQDKEPSVSFPSSFVLPSNVSSSSASGSVDCSLRSSCRALLNSSFKHFVSEAKSPPFSVMRRSVDSNAQQSTISSSSKSTTAASNVQFRHSTSCTVSTLVKSARHCSIEQGGGISTNGEF